MKTSKINFLTILLFSILIASCSEDEPKVENNPLPEPEVVSMLPKVVYYNTGQHPLWINPLDRIVTRDSFVYDNKKVVYNLRNRTSGVDQLFEYTYIGDTTIAFRNHNSDRYSVQYQVEPGKEYMEFPTFSIYAFLVTERVGNQISYSRYEWYDALPVVTEIENIGFVRWNLIITMDEKKENIVSLAAFNVKESGEFELIGEIKDLKYTEYKNPFKGLRRELPYFNNVPTNNHLVIENLNTLLPEEYTVLDHSTGTNITYKFNYTLDDKGRMVKSMVTYNEYGFMTNVESIVY